MASTAKNDKRRDIVVNALLVIAGVLLAICLFGAGLFWRGKPATKAMLVSPEFQIVSIFKK